MSEDQFRQSMIDARGPTLRDYFAMAALVGLVTKYGTGDEYVSYGNMATDAFYLADLALKKRDEK